MKLAVIVCSTRENRTTERLAAWIAKRAGERQGVATSLIDLRDYPMPFFNEPKSPRYNPDRQVDPMAQKWLAKVNEAEAYIFVTPEYNHSIPGVLKNAIDYITWEMAKKPATVASHGSVGGARAAMHLKEILSESRAAITRTQLAVIGLQHKIDAEGMLSQEEQVDPNGLQIQLDALLDELIWYSDALASARQKSA